MPKVVNVALDLTTDASFTPYLLLDTADFKLDGRAASIGARAFGR